MDKHHTQHPHSRGFTLVEMSIVLVIIGLIVGGVVAGRELVKSAGIRRVITQLSELDRATGAFRLKYDYLPGDIPNNRSTAYGLSIYTGNPNPPNGDGVLNATYASWSCCVGQWGVGEPTFVAIHLNESNLYLSGAAYSGGRGIGVGKPYIEISKYGGGIYPFTYDDRKIYWGLMLSTYTPGAADLNNHRQDGGVLTPEQAQGLDVKMDNGSPLTGVVRSSRAGANAINAYPADTVFNYSCITNNGVNSEYRVSNGNKDCNVIVRSSM